MRSRCEALRQDGKRVLKYMALRKKWRCPRGEGAPVSAGEGVAGSGLPAFMTSPRGRMGSSC